jgi:hypothetical protein
VSLILIKIKRIIIKVIKEVTYKIFFIISIINLNDIINNNNDKDGFNDLNKLKL